MAIKTPPIPTGGPDEMARVSHTRLRRRLLYSEFEGDLRARLKTNIGGVRQAAWGTPDLTANPYLTMWSGASALYDEEPIVRAPQGSGALFDTVAETGFFAQQQRVMRDTLALREMAIRVDIHADGALTFRPVFPDMLVLTANPRRPSYPLRAREFVEDPTFGWTVHDLDIRDPAAPSYTVATTKGDDVTAAVLGDSYGAGDYPFRAGDGTPILPYPLYHAAETGCLFDPYTHREIVEGSLNIGVLLTFYGHVIRNASWPQRWVVNLVPAGLSVPEGQAQNARRELVTDPSTVVVWQVGDGQATPQIGQWSAPGDPEAILRSISMYERRIHLLAGFAPPDVTRQEADIRSGYSLAVDREAMRARQRVFEPQFRRGDQEVLRVAACLSNRHAGTSYSELARDYRPEYRGLPKSPAEVRVHLEEVKMKRDAGILGPVSALRELEPQLNREEAIQVLASAALERGEVEAATDGLLKASGLDVTPVATAKPVGYVTTAAEIMAQATAGLLPIDTAVALLVAGCGFTASEAEAMAVPIRALPPRPAPGPATPGQEAA